jgi:hypothetical protein
MPVRAAVFSYFELDDLPELLRAISGAGFPPVHASISARTA